jgi:hypothetical protein
VAFFHFRQIPERDGVSTTATAIADILFQGRPILMVVKMAKEPLETFRRFQSLSNKEKPWMRAIKRMSSSHQGSQLETLRTFPKSDDKVLKKFISPLRKVPICFFTSCFKVSFWSYNALLVSFMHNNARMIQFD